MRITLAESAARHGRPSPWVGASLVAHVAAVSLLLFRGATSQTFFAPEPQILRYVVTPQESAPEPARESPSPEVILGGPPGAPRISLPEFDVPVVAPTTSVELAPGPSDFDPAHFDRRGLATTLGPTRRAGPISLGPVFDATSVDLLVRPRNGNPSPAYPPALSAAGVEGEVSVRFVVDTTGRVESGSVITVRTTNALFEREVYDALRRMRFLAAESGGAKVRQLVEQTFRFEISRARE